MAQDLRILILEDVATDAEMAERELRKNGLSFTSRRVETESSFLQQLEEFHPDLILADCALPSFDGLTALRLTRERDTTLPFILFSASLGEEQAIDSLHLGATDYVPKHQLSRLEPAVQRALGEAEARRERRLAEAALHDSEFRFRALIENSSDGIALVDRPGVIRYLSTSGERLIGYPAHELLGQRLMGLVHREDRRALTRPVAQLMREPGQSMVMSARIRCRGGAWRWMEGVYHNLLHEPGIQAVVVNFRDITERKRAETELRESERKLRGIIEQSQDGIGLTDERGIVIEWNAAEERITGLPKTQAIGRPIWEVQFRSFPKEKRTPEAYQQLQDTTQSLYRTGQAPRLGQLMETQIERAGAIRSLQEIAFAIPTEHGFMVASISRDVTVQRQAEEDLRQSEVKYRNIFENAVEGIYQSSPQGRFSSVNAAMARIFGYASPEQMMAHITTIGGQFYANPGRRAALIRQLEEIDKLENYESECLCQDGRRIWISENARAVKDPDGNLLHYEGFFHDITARRRSEEELRRRAAHQAALTAVIGSATEAGTDLYALIETGLDQTLQALGLDMGAAWLSPIPGIEHPAATRGLPAEIAAVLAHIAITEQLELDCISAVADWGSAGGTLGDIFHRCGICAFLVSPLLSDGKRIGVLAVGSPQPRAWLDEEVALVQAVGRQLGAAAERARLFEETHQRAEQLELLYEAGLTLNRVLDSGAQLEFLFRTAMKAVHADRAEFSRYDPTQKQLQFELGVGYAKPVSQKTHERLVFALEDENALVCLAARSRQPLNIPDVSAEPHWVVVDPEVRAALLVPILHEDDLLGVLGVLSTRPNAFTPQDERLIVNFGNQAAVALENARLFRAEKIRRNELTALYGLTRALADTDDLETMLFLIVHRVVESIGVTFARVALVDGDDIVIRAAHPIRFLDHDLEVGRRVALVAHPLYQRALVQDVPLVVNSDDPNITAQDFEGLLCYLAKTLCLVPLRASERTVGLLMLGEVRDSKREPYDEEKIGKIRNIGDAAASAIQRAGFRAETEKRLRHVQALHAIDTAITSSTDLRVSLDVILGHVIEQLHADAANVLLFDPLTATLQYAAGRGFDTNIIEESRLHLADGMAGTAARERKTVHLQHLVKEDSALKRSRLIVQEGFVSYYGVPLYAQGKLRGVLELFHRVPFDGDQEWLRLLETMASQTSVAIDSSEMIRDLEQSRTELELAYESTLEGWSRALDLRDKETEGHTQRVTEIAILLARAMRISQSQLLHIRRGALLHDIGKLGVPDGILLKPGPLTADEWIVMRRHPGLAFELLSPILYLRPALDVPYCHHEKWDGTGYPRGLKGEKIPLAARIFAVVDVWDALRSKRPYRDAWPEAKVRDHLKECSGKHFDPKVVEAFLTMIEAIFPENAADSAKSPSGGYPARD